MSVDFSTPFYLKNFYHISGTISLLLNTCTIYLIIFQSDKIDNFRYFLLTFQVLCTMLDFHMTFLMQPFPLHPLMAGFTEGFLGKYLDIWMHYLMTVLVGLACVQVECLAFCFLRKHQTIGRIINRHVLPTKYMVLLTAYMCALPILVCYCYLESAIPRDQQLNYISEHFPEYLTSFASLQNQNFAIYELNNFLFLLVILALFTATLIGFIFIFTTIDMFRILKESESKVSSVRYKTHRSAVKSLLAQFATSSICLSPPVVLVIVAISDVSYSQVIIQCNAAVFALHSPINSVVLMASTPPYRKFLLR